MKKITIYDTTLRDGNHAVRHQLSLNDIKTYCEYADKSNIPIVEVGHGNGLGASSLQVGFAKYTDKKMISIARRSLKKTLLSVHVMPGFATIVDDLIPALDQGVDLFRVGTHCTEANISKKFIEFCSKNNAVSYGALMMSHMVDKKTLLEQAKIYQDYGAKGVSLFDSAGAYVPNEVEEKIEYLVSNLEIDVGFHAHNNLGLGVGNSLAAAKSGAKILDAAINGFGAGSGNANLEALVASLYKSGYKTDIDLFRLLDFATLSYEKITSKNLPKLTSLSIISGLSGVFSGFNKHIEDISKEYGVDSKLIYIELGKNHVIGGQEDKIVEIASNIKKNAKLYKKKN